MSPAAPKPTPRTPKQPKPIKRSAIKKRTTKKRAWKSARCQVLRCNKKAEVEWVEKVQVVMIGTESVIDEYDETQRMCHSHARLEALRRWSLSVRTGQCELAAFHAQYNVKCAGSNIAGHGFGKGAYPSVMFEPWNGFSKCSGLNAWVEDHTLEWDGYLRETWGDKYNERRAQALQVRKYDLATVLAGFTAGSQK